MNIIQKIRKLFTFTDSSLETQLNEIIRRTNNVLQLPLSYGNISIEADGTLVFSGDAVVWNDINFPASNLKPGVTSPDWTTIVGSIAGYTFSASKDQDLHGCTEILHDYQEGTDIIPHIHWSPMTTSSGTVRWGLEYAWVNTGDVRTTSTTIYVDSVALVAGTHQVVSFPTISGTGMKIGSGLCVRIFREGTHANDTYAGDAFVPNLGIHYQCDTLGSRQTSIK
jgi:hypothetical protein